MSKTYKVVKTTAIDGYLYSTYNLGEWEIKDYLSWCETNKCELGIDSLEEYLWNCNAEDDIDHQECIEIKGLNEFLNACKEYDNSRS